MSNLGRMYQNGKGGLPKDIRQAIAWYRKDADAGDETAKTELKHFGQ